MIIALQRLLSVPESTAGSRLIKGVAMAHYRAYLIGRDGHYIKAVDLNCNDDDAAMKRAARMVDGHDVELWEHARRIAKFNGKKECPISGLNNFTSQRLIEIEGAPWTTTIAEWSWKRTSNSPIDSPRSAIIHALRSVILCKFPLHRLVQGLIGIIHVG
jgi:hypothetical protein